MLENEIQRDQDEIQVDQTEKDGIEAVQMRDDGEVKRVLLNVNSVEDPMYNEQTSCPAWEKTCSTCGRKKHFAVTCNMRYRERREESKKSLRWVEEIDSEKYIACLEVGMFVSSMLQLTAIRSGTPELGGGQDGQPPPLPFTRRGKGGKGALSI
jgi:hypothetical protein